jgi:DNA-directed RNA polymerase subunit M/transcription elongation factor TFIIS
MAPGLVARVGNTVGPITPQQQAAVAQLLIEQGRVDEIPTMELHPEQYAKEMAEIQQNPNVAPLVDPSQSQPAPMGMPPGGQPGAMPQMDPSQPGGGGGQPMQPMSKKADANNALKRCPKCNSATTTVEGYGDNTGDGSTAYAKCHSCQHVWDPHTSSRRIQLIAMPNPLLDPVDVQHQQNQSTLTWKDATGQSLQEGQVYNISSPKFQQPDIIRVERVKPDEIVGTLVDYGTPITIHKDQASRDQYTFEAADDGSNRAPDPNGGMPGLEQIPQTPPTTDQQSSMEPNLPTTSHTLASIALSDESDPEAEDLCHRCGASHLSHTYSSATTILHECWRCGSAWESKDDFEGIEPNANLEWIKHDSGPGGDDFFANYDRINSMNAMAGTQSRDFRASLDKDRRYQQVHELLESNAMQREAGKHFTQGEQRALINEHGTARNLEDLNLEGTHYKTRYDYTGKANGANVPVEHTFLGI